MARRECDGDATNGDAGDADGADADDGDDASAADGAGDGTTCA